MEAQAICDAIVLYRDASGVHDRIAAMERMGRLLTHGSPAAQEACRIWRDMVLGPPPPTTLSGLAADRDGYDRVEPMGSDYTD